MPPKGSGFPVKFTGSTFPLIAVCWREEATEPERGGGGPWKGEATKGKTGVIYVTIGIGLDLPSRWPEVSISWCVDLPRAAATWAFAKTRQPDGKQHQGIPPLSRSFHHSQTMLHYHSSQGGWGVRGGVVCWRGGRVAGERGRAGYPESPLGGGRAGAGVAELCLAPWPLQPCWMFPLLLGRTCRKPRN